MRKVDLQSNGEVFFMCLECLRKFQFCVEFSSDF